MVSGTVVVTCRLYQSDLYAYVIISALIAEHPPQRLKPRTVDDFELEAGCLG